MFSKLTEIEAITLYTILDNGQHSIYVMPWQEYTSKHSAMAGEISTLIGQLAFELANGPANSTYLLQLILPD